MLVFSAGMACATGSRSPCSEPSRRLVPYVYRTPYRANLLPSLTTLYVRHRSPFLAVDLVRLDLRRRGTFRLSHRLCITRNVTDGVFPKVIYVRATGFSGILFLSFGGHFRLKFPPHVFCRIYFRPFFLAMPENTWVFLSPPCFVPCCGGKRGRPFRNFLTKFIPTYSINLFGMYMWQCLL